MRAEEPSDWGAGLPAASLPAPGRWPGPGPAVLTYHYLPEGAGRMCVHVYVCVPECVFVCV